MKITRHFAVTIEYDDEVDLEGNDYLPRNSRQTRFWPSSAVNEEAIWDALVVCSGPTAYGWFANVKVTEE